MAKDLPVSAKSIDLVVQCGGFLSETEIVHIFIATTLITEVVFKKFLACTAVLQVEPS